MSANIWELCAWRFHQVRSTRCFQNHNKELALAIWIWTADLSSALFPAMPRNASSSAVHHFLQAPLELHSPRPSASLLPYFAVFLLTFILYFPLYTSVYIPQLHFINMEPMASQVRNHYSQKNQDAHLERALQHAFMKTAHLHCRSNIWSSNPGFEYNVSDS